MDHRGLDPKIKSHQREVISTQLTYIIKCRMNLNRQYVWIPMYGRLRSLKIHRIFTQEEDIVTYVTSRNCPRSSLAYSAHLSLSLSSLLLRKSQPRPAFVTKKKPLSILPPLSLCVSVHESLAMQETELHDLSDDADYAASQLHVSISQSHIF